MCIRDRARTVCNGVQQPLFRVLEADAEAVVVGHALKQAHGIVLLAGEAVVEVQKLLIRCQFYTVNMWCVGTDRKSTRLNSSHSAKSRMPSSA